MPSPSLPPSPQITHTWNTLYSTHGRCVPCLCVLFACSVPVVNITPIRCTSTHVCGPSCNYLFLFLVCSVMYYLLFLSDVPSRAPPGNSHELLHVAQTHFAKQVGKAAKKRRKKGLHPPSTGQKWGLSEFCTLKRFIIKLPIVDFLIKTTGCSAFLYKMAQIRGRFGKNRGREGFS